MNPRKFTDEEILSAMPLASCVSDVMRIIGSSLSSGGCHKHISKRIKLLGLSKKDFGKKLIREGKKRNECDIFVVRDSSKGRDQNLAKAMVRFGFSKKCSGCGIDSWLGKPLRIEVDHIDGNPLNNLKDNLRFMCPNCHSQTETFVNCKRVVG